MTARFSKSLAASALTAGVLGLSALISPGVANAVTDSSPNDVILDQSSCPATVSTEINSRAEVAIQSVALRGGGGKKTSFALKPPKRNNATFRTGSPTATVPGRLAQHGFTVNDVPATSTEGHAVCSGLDDGQSVSTFRPGKRTGLSDDRAANSTNDKRKR